MVSYKKELYPELTQADFDEYIAPLLKSVGSLSVNYVDCLKNAVPHENQELYPYHNSCMTIAIKMWDNIWDTELEKHILDPKGFKNASCEILSQLAFSYLIRCFAEHIKTISGHYNSPFNIYKHFIQELVSSNFKEFSDTYSIGWGRCNNLLRNKVNAIKKAIRLAQKHRSELEEKFNIPFTSRIVSMESNGDTHNNGSAVTIIAFEHGHKIVFKPRSVSGELGYANLVRELNNFISPKMRSLKVIDFVDYGFTSFIDVKDEKRDMFQAGRLACLMYFLNATDMHYSNILWTDQDPLPIDLETLFHPARVRSGISESKKSAYRALETSVYGTGVLPLILNTKTNNGSLDVGFTGIRDRKSVSPLKIFDVVDGFSSNIKVVWNNQKIDNKLLIDNDLESLIYERCDKIIDGFVDFFWQVFRQKDFFAEAVLRSFSGAKFRYIHNMTYKYVQILRCLTDAEPSKDIDTAHALLTRIGILSTSSDPNIVLSECRQLWNGDVPYFSIKFDGTDVFNEEKIISKVVSSPKSEFISKLKRLSEKDLTRQIELIRLAFIAKLADPHADGRLDFEGKRIRKSEIVQSKDNSTLNNAQNSNLKEIISWFSESLSESLLDDRYAHLPKTWIGPVARFGNQGWTPGVLGYDLYGGRVGPALALAASGKVLSDEKLIKIASEVFEISAQILESKTYELRNVLLSGSGAFSGVSGLLWSLCAASDITGNTRWRKVAVNSWSLLPKPLTGSDIDFFDMITGTSASIIMRYHTQVGFLLNNDAINQCVSLAYLKINSSDLKITSGLAHGLGQLLWYFSSIAQKQSTREIQELIIKIDSIIRKRYTTDDGIIQTYCGGVEQVSSSWCNGLAGLLIAYYEAYKANSLPQESVINIINQLKRIPLSRVPILCHGSLGIVEVLQYVGQSLPNQTSAILSRLETTFSSPEYIYSYYKNGRGRYTLSPGLMAGRAGALLHLCRSFDPTMKVSPITLGN